MPLLRLLLVILLFTALLPGQSAGKRGIEVSDLNRSVQPCSDFYEFANGSWRAANPIPPSMQRWSRRWAAGETAKDRLRDILVEISARKDYPKGSVLKPTDSTTPSPRVYEGRHEIQVALERTGDWQGTPLLTVQYQACTNDACMEAMVAELDIAVDRG